MYRIKSALLLVLLALGMASAPVSAQKLIPCRNAVANGYNFWLYHPARTTDSTGAEIKKPLIVFLHGASLRGSNLERVRRYGVLHAISMGLDIDAHVLAPQVPSGGSWIPKKINNCIDYAIAHSQVDTNRIYVIGMSLGGFGTYDYTNAYPNRVAAAVAICGGSNNRSFCNLNEVPLWILHGAADRQVSVQKARHIVSNMRQCSAGATRLIYTEWPNVNHTFPARVMYLAKTYEWLFAHSLDQPGRPAKLNVNITTNEMQAAYKTMKRNRHTITVENLPPDEDAAPGLATSDFPELEEFEEIAPAPAAAEPQTSDAQYYKVRQGDTLEKIAKRNGTTINALVKLNKLKNRNRLKIGQRLRIR